MREGKIMDMEWQTMLHEAADISFVEKHNTVVVGTENSSGCIDLQSEKIRELSEKILLLSDQGIALLLGRYCFDLSWTSVENLLQLQHAKECDCFYRKMLSRSIGLDEGVIVSDQSFRRACRKTLKKYVRKELRTSAEVDGSKKRQAYMVLNKMGRAVAIVLVTSMLLFSGTMAVNAKFRDKVVTWVIEVFDDFCAFQVHQEDDDTEKELSDYHISYVPEVVTLQRTIEQPKLIAYEYTVKDGGSLTILFSKEDTTVYIGVEDAEMQPLELDEATGYFMNENGMNYICFERKGNFFAVCGTLDESELIKIANGITSE